MSSEGRRDLGAIVKHFRPELSPYATIYQDVHQHPELSCKESRTSSVVIKELTRLNYIVHNDIGGHGVVGVLKNGKGPVVLLRSELDALPIKEATGLPYASTARMADQYGFENPVMHACGHELHMSCLLAASDLLSTARSQWQGTLVVLFQPNEEHTGGAQAMLDAGLYDRIPIPDIFLAQHPVPLKEGTINIRPGPVLTAADTFHVRIDSKDEQSVNPQEAINPINVICSIVAVLEDALKDITSSGRFANIIPEEIHAGRPGLDTVYESELVLDVKSYHSVVRQQSHETFRNIVKAECKATGIRNTPSITHRVRAPLTDKNPEVVAAIKASIME